MCECGEATRNLLKKKVCEQSMLRDCLCAISGPGLCVYKNLLFCSSGHRPSSGSPRRWRTPPSPRLPASLSAPSRSVVVCTHRSIYKYTNNDQFESSDAMDTHTPARTTAKRGGSTSHRAPTRATASSSFITRKHSSDPYSAAYRKVRGSVTGRRSTGEPPTSRAVGRCGRGGRCSFPMSRND